MKQVIYRESIIIDGREYIVSSGEFSKQIDQLIYDNVLVGNDQEIVNHLVDDIVNSQ